MLASLKERCEKHGLTMTEYLERLVQQDIKKPYPPPGFLSGKEELTL
jgi:hypothetical protein